MNKSAVYLRNTTRIRSLRKAERAAIRLAGRSKSSRGFSPWDRFTGANGKTVSRLSAALERLRVRGKVVRTVAGGFKVNRTAVVKKAWGTRKRRYGKSGRGAGRSVRRGRR